MFSMGARGNLVSLGLRGSFGWCGEAMEVDKTPFSPPHPYTPSRQMVLLGKEMSIIEFFCGEKRGSRERLTAFMGGREEYLYFGRRSSWVYGK